MTDEEFDWKSHAPDHMPEVIAEARRARKAEADARAEGYAAAREQAARNLDAEAEFHLGRIGELHQARGRTLRHAAAAIRSMTPDGTPCPLREHHGPEQRSSCPECDYMPTPPGGKEPKP